MVDNASIWEERNRLVARLAQPSPLRIVHFFPTFRWMHEWERYFCYPIMHDTGWKHNFSRHYFRRGPVDCYYLIAATTHSAVECVRGHTFTQMVVAGKPIDYSSAGWEAVDLARTIVRLKKTEAGQ